MYIIHFFQLICSINLKQFVGYYQQLFPGAVHSIGCRQYGESVKSLDFRYFEFIYRLTYEMCRWNKQLIICLQICLFAKHHKYVYEYVYNTILFYLWLPTWRVTESINSSDSSWHYLTYQRSTSGHLLTDCTSLFLFQPDPYVGWWATSSPPGSQVLSSLSIPGLCLVNL